MRKRKPPWKGERPVLRGERKASRPEKKKDDGPGAQGLRHRKKNEKRTKMRHLLRGFSPGRLMANACMKSAGVGLKKKA